MKRIAFAVLFFFSFISLSFGFPHSKTGKITNITSLHNGLLIILDTGVPDNCAEVPYGWMFIPQENKAMTAVTLIAYTLTPNNTVTVYTNPYDPGIGCEINQLDPN